MTAITDVVDLEVRGKIALVTIDNPPVNALARGVRDGLFEALTQAREDAAVEAVVIACQGRTFIAGADIREFGRPLEGRVIFEAQDAIESSPKPVIAALHGTALGGGLEVALCCHYRVAVESARFGLPEVKLGILPGAGGTQRLPRVVGVEKALSMMTSGDPIGADEALATGLIDAIVSGDLVERALAYAEQVVAEGRPLEKVRESNDELDAVRGKPEIFDGFRKGIARKTRGFLAPEAIVQCVEAAVVPALRRSHPFRAREVPRARHQPSVDSPALLLLRRTPGQQDPRRAQEHAPASDPQGRHHRRRHHGRRHLDELRQCGHSGDASSRSNRRPSIAASPGAQELRAQRQPRPHHADADVEERTGAHPRRISTSSALADCDLVIEAVFENMDLKKDIFRKLGDVCKDGAILASNTSALDINEIASVSGRPEAVIGLHFFSPANVMKLIEIVRGDETGGSVIATCMALARKIGKVAVLVGVCRGFVGNRMLFARTLQSEKLILQGALPWDVDRVLYDFGFPMGPFAMIDLAGLDIGWNPKTSRGETLRDRLCEMGRRGQKLALGQRPLIPTESRRRRDPNASCW